jgi:hypothetical protein
LLRLTQPHSNLVRLIVHGSPARRPDARARPGLVIVATSASSRRQDLSLEAAPQWHAA